jgi:uncharacterized protein YdeI (YjbR/CyaY-like superfamily)
MITAIEDYYGKGCGRCERFTTSECSALIWSEGLQSLRRICRESKLIETVKWGHPCWMHSGRNIVILGALRSDFRISFFNSALLKDPQGILERQGPNTRHPDMIRFRSNGQVNAMETTIRSYLIEAISYAEAGIRPEKDETELELPAELAEALDADAALAQAFRSLSRGRQRSYVINLSSARKPSTRISRIAKFRDHILAGKGALER